ncbi:MAG TPA: hypothetical protein VLA56_14365 [Pseudomonadales bacterium]|nr:hypothetical protein [Pseudomonadales bacterium]
MSARAPILPAMLLALLALHDSMPAAHASTPLDWFVGDWRVAVRGADAAAGDLDRSFDWAVRPALDGAWLAGSVLVDGSVWTHEFQGVDPATGMLVRSVMSADGSLVRFESAGWDGDLLVWEGTLHAADGITHLREEIRRLGDDAAEARFLRREPGSGAAWSLMQTEQLRRR